MSHLKVGSLYLVFGVLFTVLRWLHATTYIVNLLSPIPSSWDPVRLIPTMQRCLIQVWKFEVFGAEKDINYIRLVYEPVYFWRNISVFM